MHPQSTQHSVSPYIMLFTSAIALGSLFITLASAYLFDLSAYASNERPIVAGVSFGSLVTAPSSKAVYYIGDDGKRYVFPNERAYRTWYADFSTVQRISDGELASYPLGGNVTYRPGIRLVKIESDPKVYAVTNGGELRWVTTETIAEQLYGTDWNTQVDDVPVPFFINYTIGSDIIDAADYSRQTIITASPDIRTDWVVWRTARLKVKERNESGTIPTTGGGGGGGGTSGGNTSGGATSGGGTSSGSTTGGGSAGGTTGGGGTSGGSTTGGSTGTPGTTPSTDTTAPTISTIRATNITSTSGTISAVTNEPARVVVTYGKDIANLSGTSPATQLGANHTVTLSNLQANSVYYYIVSATDSSNNTRTSQVDFFVTPAVPINDTVAPQITISPRGGNFTSAQTVALSINEPGTIYYTLTGTTPTTASAVYTGSIVISTNTTLKVLAIDSAGNQAAVQTETYTIMIAQDTTPPTASFITPQNGASVSGVLVLSVNATDAIGVAGVRFFVNGTPLGTEITSSSYTTSWDTTVVANGSYTIMATARDIAGNTRSTTITVGVSNVSTPPPPPSSGGGSGVSLGSLTVAASRIPTWYAFDESIYNQARSWTEYDGTCTSSPCASGRAPIPSSWGCSPANPAANGSQDAGDITCLMNNAPNNSVIFLPNGTYEMGGGTSNNVIIVRRSNVVLRGQDSRNTKILIRNDKMSGACNNTTDCGAMAVSISAPNLGSGVITSWTGGFSAGTKTITVADASQFQPGDWVNTTMSGAPGCEYIDRVPAQAGQSGYFGHIVKIVSVSGNQITIDRGLRMDYSVSTCGPKSVTKLTPIKNVGLENLYIGLDPAIFSNVAAVNGVGKSRGVTLYGAVDSWVTNNFFNRFDEDVLLMRYSARNWLQGNWTQDVGADTQFNTDGFYLAHASVDNVIENNIFLKNNVASKQESGAEGNVSAYNYIMFTANVPGALASYRQNGFFHHGRYTREQLWEGNHSDTTMLIADRWWGRNGPRITAYRNRTYSSNNIRQEAIVTSKDGPTGWPEADILNIIGNVASGFYDGPPLANGFPQSMGHAQDIDNLATNVHAEKNIYIDAFGWQHDSPNASTNCGTGAGNCPGSNPGPNPSSGTNVQGKAPSSWLSDSVPVSLYRNTTPPSWWCKETISKGGPVCEWANVHQSIGAWGDNVNGTLCKLPAQVISEGGPCTPYGGNATPTPPPTTPPTTPSDTTPPTVSFTAPASNATVSGTLTISASVSDASGIASVMFSINGVAIITDTSSPYSTTIDTTRYINGTYTLAASAVDTAGNTNSTSRTITINNTTTPPPTSGDTTPPTVSITSPSSGSTQSGTITVSASASDASGIASVAFSVNGTTISTDTTSPYSATVNTAGYSNGSLSITATALDTAGNLNAISVTIQVNNTSTPPPSSSLPNPIAYWSFNDGNGTFAGDNSGNGHTGTISGASWVTGKSGSALSFDGSNDTVDFGSASSLDDIAPLSFSLWIQPSSSSGQQYLISKRTQGQSSFWRLEQSGAAFNFFRSASGASLNVTGTASNYSTTGWNHIVLVWDGTLSTSGVHVYVNGVEAPHTTNVAGSGSITSDGANNMSIGSRDGSGNFYAGLIDEVRLYNTVLTASDVQALFAL